jgi:Mechanosensitive ion channel, conserved TM helix
MDSVSDWFSALGRAASDALADAASQLPSLMGAILILIAGWLFARVARGTARRISNGANRLLDRMFQRGALASARLSPAAMPVLGEIAFWVIVFLAATIAARVAGLTAVAEWLNQIATQLPDLLVGAAIIGAGYFVSVLVGEQVALTARAAKADQSALMGMLAQSAIFVTSLIIGLDQIGVDVTFLIVLFAVTVGAIFLGFSIAFGLGARDFVSNLVGARNARRALRAGLFVRIGDVEGEILEFTPTQIALDTARGRTLVPARFADEQSILILAAADRKPADG